MVASVSGNGPGAPPQGFFAILAAFFFSTSKSKRVAVPSAMPSSAQADCANSVDKPDIPLTAANAIDVFINILRFMPETISLC